MDIDNQNNKPLRRSQRIKNKYKSPNGSQLTGDKYFLFTHNFNNDNNHKRRLNTNTNNNNNDANNPPLYPQISRCKRQLKMVHHNPNVFTIDNFLTQNEINHLLNIVQNHSTKFETSYTQATEKDQIYSSERTSTFIFLQKYMDKISRAIECRAADIVSISIENVEPLQVVRYTQGQQFTLHHDAGTLINETLKASSSSLWSLASNQTNNSNVSNVSGQSNHSLGGYSVDFIRNPQIYQNINTHNNKKNNNKPLLLPNLQFHNQPQQLTSAQYVKLFQQWQQQLQQQAMIAQQQLQYLNNCNNNDQKPRPARRPQSCPPPAIIPLKVQGNAFDTKGNGQDVKEEDEDDKEEKYESYSVQIVAPVRLFSFFVYLTTLPEGGGGETYFPKLGLKVRPERGKAVLWSNVDVNNTLKADAMLIHSAKPVKGNHLKIGMNIWIDNAKVEANYRQ